MSLLNIALEYDNDSDNDEMPDEPRNRYTCEFDKNSNPRVRHCVDISDSISPLKKRKVDSSVDTEIGDSFVVNEDIQLRNGRKRIPLPNEIKELYECHEKKLRYEENAEDHAGRIRSFEHVRGNWASFCSISYHPEAEFFELLDRLVHECSCSVQLTPQIEFHISLTRTFVIKHHWIQPFTSMLRNSLKPLQRFTVGLSYIDLFTNEEGTRTFLSLKVEHGADYLKKIVSELDNCLEQFKLPPFYQPPSFHMSIAWCVGNRVKELCPLLESLQMLVERFIAANPDALTISVSNLNCKTGNKYFNFPLKS